MVSSTVTQDPLVPARSPLRKSPFVNSTMQFGGAPATPPDTPKLKKSTAMSPIVISQLDYAYNSFSDEDDGSYSEGSIFSADPQSPTLPKHTITESDKSTKLSPSQKNQVSLMEILNEEVDTQSVFDIDEDFMDELELLDVISSSVISNVTERVSFSMGAVFAEVNVAH